MRLQANPAETHRTPRAETVVSLPDSAPNRANQMKKGKRATIVVEGEGLGLGRWSSAKPRVAAANCSWSHRENQCASQSAIASHANAGQEAHSVSRRASLVTVSA